MDSYNNFVSKAFAPALKEFAGSLLDQVAKDYNLEAGELKGRYLFNPEWIPAHTPQAQVPLPQEPKAKAPRQIKEKPKEQMCTGLTSKGEPCKFVAKCDGLCGIHLRKRDAPPKEEKEGADPPSKKKGGRKPKEVTPKPSPPEHTHPLTEEPEEVCTVCETQGNVMNPELSKAEFEAVAEEGKSLQDRLKAILANAEQDEEDEDPEEEATEAEEPEEETMEAEEPEEMQDIMSKLAGIMSKEDDEEYTEEDMEQMTETPPSRAKLEELKKKVGGGYDFNALIEEDEEDEE